MAKKHLTKQERTMGLLNLATGCINKTRALKKERARTNRFADITHQIGKDGVFVGPVGSKVYKTRSPTVKGETPLYLFDKKQLNKLCKNNIGGM